MSDNKTQQIFEFADKQQYVCKLHDKLDVCIERISFSIVYVYCKDPETDKNIDIDNNITIFRHEKEGFLEKHTFTFSPPETINN